MSEILPTTTLRLASISVITAITTKTGGASTMQIEKTFAVLSSACATLWLTMKVGSASTKQIEKNIRCIVFCLHYSMAHHEGRRRLNNTN